MTGKTVGELRAFLEKFADDTPVAIVFCDDNDEQRTEPLGVTHAQRRVHSQGWVNRPMRADEGVETVLLYSEYAV